MERFVFVLRLIVVGSVVILAAQALLLYSLQPSPSITEWETAIEEIE